MEHRQQLLLSLWKSLYLDRLEQCTFHLTARSLVHAHCLCDCSLQAYRPAPPTQSMCGRSMASGTRRVGSARLPRSPSLNRARHVTWPSATSPPHPPSSRGRLHSTMATVPSRATKLVSRTRLPHLQILFLFVDHGLLSLPLWCSWNGQSEYYLVYGTSQSFTGAYLRS